MEVTIKVPDNVAAAARERGVAVEVYVQEILARQPEPISNQSHLASIGRAIDEIRRLREGNSLRGVNIKDLIHEGHKY